MKIENKENQRIEYYAVAKDGKMFERLKNEKEAKRVKKDGKCKFWITYVEGVRKYEDFTLECDVYEKQIETKITWNKI